MRPNIKPFIMLDGKVLQGFIQDDTTKSGKLWSMVKLNIRVLGKKEVEKI